MPITLTELFIWLIIAAIVGFVGEALAGRRGAGGLLGAIVVGFLAILLVVGVFHFSIAGEPFLNGVPLISSILTAIVVVLIWSFVAFRRVAPSYRRSFGFRRRRWL